MPCPAKIPPAAVPASERLTGKFCSFPNLMICDGPMCSRLQAGLATSVMIKTDGRRTYSSKVKYDCQA